MALKLEHFGKMDQKYLESSGIWCWKRVEKFGLTDRVRNEKLLHIRKGKSVPLHFWSGPEGSRKLRFPDYVTIARGGGKVVSATHRPPLPPGNTPGTHFC